MALFKIVTLFQTFLSAQQVPSSIGLFFKLRTKVQNGQSPHYVHISLRMARKATSAVDGKKLVFLFLKKSCTLLTNGHLTQSLPPGIVPVWHCANAHYPTGLCPLSFCSGWSRNENPIAGVSQTCWSQQKCLLKSKKKWSLAFLFCSPFYLFTNAALNPACLILFTSYSLHQVTIVFLNERSFSCPHSVLSA